MPGSGKDKQERAFHDPQRKHTTLSYVEMGREDSRDSLLGPKRPCPPEPTLLFHAMKNVAGRTGPGSWEMCTESPRPGPRVMCRKNSTSVLCGSSLLLLKKPGG